MDNMLIKLGCNEYDYYIDINDGTPLEIIKLYIPNNIYILSLTQHIISDLYRKVVTVEDTIEETTDHINSNIEAEDLLTDDNNSEEEIKHEDDTEDTEDTNAVEIKKANKITRNIRISSSYFYCDIYDDTIKLLPKYEKILDNLNRDYNKIIKKNIKSLYLLNVHNNNNGIRFLPFVINCKNFAIQLESTNSTIKNMLLEQLHMLGIAQDESSLNIYKKVENYNISIYFSIICDIINNSNNDIMKKFRFYICDKSNSITIIRDLDLDLYLDLDLDLNVEYVYGLCISEHGLFYSKMTCSFDIDDGFNINYKLLSDYMSDNIINTIYENLYIYGHTDYLNEYKVLNKKTYCVNKLRNFYGNCFGYYLFNNYAN